MRRLALTAALSLALAAPGAAQPLGEPADAPAFKARPLYGAQGREGAAEARKEMEALRAELARIAADTARSSDDVASARARLAALNVRESALLKELGRDRGRLSRLLSALQLFRRDPPPALLVSPADAKDAVRAAILIRAMTPELERRAEAFAGEARQIAALRRQAAAANADLFAAESAAAEQKADIERLIAEQAEFERRYADQAVAAGRAAGSPGEVTARFPKAETGRMGALGWPVAGTIARRFGEAGEAGGRAQGVSIRTQKGAIVHAPAQGTVEFAGPVTGWGVILIVRTAGAYHLVLAGMDQVRANLGQSVAAGEPVGLMGKGGGSDPELYLEVRQAGAPADPMRWLAAPAGRTASR